MGKKRKRTPSGDRPRQGTAASGTSATRYTPPTGKNDEGGARRRRAVSGGPRRGRLTPRGRAR